MAADGRGPETAAATAAAARVEPLAPLGAAQGLGSPALAVAAAAGQVDSGSRASTPTAKNGTTAAGVSGAASAEGGGTSTSANGGSIGRGHGLSIFLRNTPELRLQQPNPHVYSPRRAPSGPVPASGLTCLALRLVPGDELVRSLMSFVVRNKLRAPFIMTCVGSAQRATIRLASASASNPNPIVELTEFLEICSLVGTLTPPNQPHLHVSLSDKDGRVVGGHLISLEVFTTAEIVIGECAQIAFERDIDDRTGFDELVVRKRSASVGSSAGSARR